MQIHRRSVLGGMAASVAAPSLVRAAEPLTIGIVPGNAIHWVQLVAADVGFYKAEGFDAAINTIQSSPQSIQFAITGQYQLATSQPEIIVAAVEQGATQLAAMSAPTNSSDWVLVGNRDVKTLKDLQGKIVGVSSLRTSEAWLTSALMQQKGFAKDSVRYQPAGTSPAKVSALETANIGAAVLFQPSAEVAIRMGFPVLARFEGMRAYPTVLYNVNKEWAAKGEAGMRVSRAIQKAHAWLYDPANKKQAMDISAKYTKREIPIVETVYDSFFATGKIYSRNGEISVEGLQNALNDMAEDGAVFKTAPKANKYLLDKTLGGLFV
jgi:ABC-type nitrate/sulfonate/bicarbonate transport system substrate-binding protein